MNVLKFSKSDMSRLKEVYEKSRLKCLDILVYRRFPLMYCQYELTEGRDLYCLFKLEYKEDKLYYSLFIKADEGQVGNVDCTVEYLSEDKKVKFGNYSMWTDKKNREFMEKMMTTLFFAHLAVSYLMLNSVKIFAEQKDGSHLIRVGKKSNKDEQIYRVINPLISVVYKEPTKSTGNGTPHSHEYDVRGHWRTYKSGKSVFIRPFTKCKGRGKKNIHEYNLKGAVI